MDYILNAANWVAQWLVDLVGPELAVLVGAAIAIGLLYGLMSSRQQP